MTATRTPARPAPIDPRIRQRRVDVLREQGRRRLRVLLVAVVVASCVALAWLAVESPALDVDHVDAPDGVHTAAPDIVAASGVRPGEPMAMLDERAAARRIEALPWVARAEVQRRWPNRVRLAIVERDPVAWARRPSPDPAQPGAVALLDASGRVLTDLPEPFPGLPELVGLAAVPAPGATAGPARITRVPGELPVELARLVGRVVVTPSGTTLVLVAPPGEPPPGAGEVRLGTLERIRQKGLAALAVLSQLAPAQARYLDVRVPTSPATG